MLGATPFTVNDFTSGGQFAEADWNSFMGPIQASSTLEDLGEYSAQVENWHNVAHGVVADVTNTPAMMDFRRNVFLSLFWRLHGFINQKFEQEMRSYADNSHPRLRSASAIVRHIENEHHLAVERI